MSESRQAVTALFGPLTDDERARIREMREFDDECGFVGIAPTEGATVEEAATFVLDASEDDALAWLEARLRGWRLPFIAFQETPAPG